MIVRGPCEDLDRTSVFGERDVLGIAERLEGSRRGFGRVWRDRHQQKLYGFGLHLGLLKAVTHELECLDRFNGEHIP